MRPKLQGIGLELQIIRQESPVFLEPEFLQFKAFLRFSQRA
jgi:hypothetical protein